MIRIDTSLDSLEHKSARELVGDIWFFRKECRYLEEAWLEHPKNYAPESLIDNENTDVFLRACGIFSIPASFYLRHPTNLCEYNAFRHLAAVDASMCFHQLGFVLFWEGCDRDLIPLGRLGLDTHHAKRTLVAVNTLIAKLNTVFVRSIDPAKFSGSITLNKVYTRDASSGQHVPFLELHFRFEDEKGGLALGQSTLVVLAQNIEGT
jgi:hypothetical protein